MWQEPTLHYPVIFLFLFRDCEAYTSDAYPKKILMFLLVDEFSDPIMDHYVN